MYIYEGHLGSLYTSDRELDWDEIYCETCNDSDWLLGYAETKEDAWKILEDITDINGSGGYDYDYIMKFLNVNWDDDFVPTIKHYTDLNCPECGAKLTVYYDGTRAGDPEPTLIRHCEKCLCDWESELHEDGSESALRRKFWG
jgi:DNA-directed RNA polymerase subunit M/transcription elongation factor TFIIS